MQFIDLDEARSTAARFHITAVTKQSVTSTVTALENMTTHHHPSSNGSGASCGIGRYILAVSMASALGDRSPREERMSLLRELIIKACDREHAITLLADIFDLCGPIPQQSAEKVHELIQKSLNLSAVQQVLFALSLTFASGEAWRDVGQQLLVRVLETQNVDTIKTLFGAKNYSHHLLQFAAVVTTIPALRSTPWATSLCAFPFTVPPMEASLTSASLKGSSMEESLSISKVVCELGAVCISSAEDCKDLLSMFPPSAIHERSVAELLCLLASPSQLQSAASQELNAYPSIRASMGLPESKSGSVHTAGPQTSVVVQAIKDVVKDGSTVEFWNRVLVALDQPGLRLERFASIAAAYKKGTNEQLPVAPFLNDTTTTTRKWRNTAIQAAALKFALDNPELVGKTALKQPNQRALPKEFKTPDDMSDLWRIEAFVDSVVHASAREHDLDAALQIALQKSPASLAAVLLGCPSPTVRHFVLASLAIKGASSLAAAVTPATVQYCAAESCTPSLVGVLSEIAQSDPSRVFELSELCVSLGLTEAVLKCAPYARFVVEVALCAKEGGQTPDKWLEQALSDANRSRPNQQSHSRFSIANSLLEAADDLLTRQKHVASATAALQLLSQSQSALAAFPGIVAHAKLLIQGDAAFSSDVEEEATAFFKAIYSDDANAPMTTIERLHRSVAPRDKNVLACIVHILFEEARTLADYPWKQLQTAARLFGQLIASPGILSNARLEQGLRLLLSTILKQTDMKTYEYGIIALEQCKLRLLEWPAFGKQLKGVVDLDMCVPGIMGIINLGIAKEAAEEENSKKSAGGSSTVTDKVGNAFNTPANTPSTETAVALHQMDIRTLLDNSSTAANCVAPPPVVQDQINFLVGNTDPSNIETSASELSSLLKPEFHAYFADYLVVKRVSLEPNFHRMYLQLVEKMDSRELEKKIRAATVGAVKRLLSSDRIRTDTNERSLLKNLGSWLGCVTLAKNIPVLSRDLDFKEMLYQGLREGKLIAVVPFIAKVLDQSVNSRYFRPPNPWTLAQLGHLYEMYRLPDLKLTLRFEVEVLCKNIGITVQEVEEIMRGMYGGNLMSQRRLGVPFMADIRASLDINGSTDFRLEETGRNDGTPPPGHKPRGLQADAAPYQPRAAPQSTVEPLPPPRPPVEIKPDTVRVSDEVRLLPPARHAAYSQALVKTLEPALKEVQAHVERASVIAAYSARELVVKDFARDPDTNLLRRAGQAMARSLASNLCTAIVKEHLSTALRKHLLVLASHLTDNQQTRTEITESIANNNFDLAVRFLEYQSNELAGRKIEELLAPIVEEKRKQGDSQPVPVDQVSVQGLLSTLPDTLRPTGAMPQAQRVLYEDFFYAVPVVEQLSSLIRLIEDAALRHYNISGAEVLSLTSPMFTERQLSEYHVTIRNKLVEVAHLVNAETAVQLIGFVFQRLMDITENLTRIDVSRTETKPVVATTQLLNEVFLFIIQSTNEKGKEKSLAELTRCYLAHERRWKNPDIVVNFMRLRVIDVSKFDEALSRALNEMLAVQHQQPQQSRSIVEFAGQVIQKVLIDDKIATSKDLPHTLQMLEQIARTRQQQQQQQLAMVQQQQQQRQGGSVSPALKGPVTPVAQLAPQLGGAPPAPAAIGPSKSASPGPAGGAPSAQSPYAVGVKSIRVKSLFAPERRAEVEPLFDEWIHICKKKADVSSGSGADGAESGSGGSATSNNTTTEQTTHVLSMQLVKKLQMSNMLLTDRNQLDAFLGTIMELSVEHYATVALASEREYMASNAPTNNVPGGAPTAATVSAKGAAPPHRFPSSPELFLKCDAFSDLVVLLVRCCSWSGSGGSAASGQQQPNASVAENTAKAEVALIGRVLQVTVRILGNNHDAIQNNLEGPPLPRGVSDVAYQRVFMQQPYVRVLSNLLIAIHRTHGETAPSAAAAANVAEPPTTTEDILRYFSDALRNTAPLRAPAFAFGWLECVSHRLFVVRMLKNRRLWDKYAGLLCEALKFVEFFTKGSNGVPSNVLVFTKAFLKLMLILLHDFPDFVLSWHVQLCDAIPPCCVQLRNVVLCAFPHSIKLPDPFAQNLNIDRLPEMAQAPPQQEGYRRQVFAQCTSTLTMDDVTAYVVSARGSNNNNASSFPLKVLEAVRSPSTGRWNVPLMNSVVLHAACAHLNMTNQTLPQNFAESPAFELYRELARLLDTEGRYYFVNACVNHLRYPNSHTHFFSMVLLHLFLPAQPQHAAQLADRQEVIQEQITRVLVERLIISRPHPWGLLITFIELIKNKRYCFWEKIFIRCTPEIEKMFDSLLKSISGSTAAAAAAANPQQAIAPVPPQ